MWVNGDDQGRLSGDPEEIKYAVCPNVDHITKKDIPELLKELEDNKLILCYDTPKSAALQILDWWASHQKLQWAWPSEYPPPEGWQDHLRYKSDAHTVETLNWPVSGERSAEDTNVRQVSSETPSGEPSTISPLTTPSSKYVVKEEEEVEVRGRGRGNSPEDSGERSAEDINNTQVSERIPSAELPSASPTNLTISNETLFDLLLNSFKNAWAQVPAATPWETIPREPKPRETAQLRDLGKKLAAAGGCPDTYISLAFNEASSQGIYKISYVRAIILDWMGVTRDKSP